MGQGTSVPAKKSREDIDDSECESVQLIPHDKVDIVNDEVPRKHFIFGLRLPSEYWSRQTFQNKNIAIYQTAEHHKSKVPPVAFNKFEIGERNSPSCTIFLAGHLHCQRTIESEEEAQELLVYAEKLSVCCGVGNTSEFKRLDVSDCPTLSANGLFSAVCDGSVSQDYTCKFLDVNNILEKTTAVKLSAVESFTRPEASRRREKSTAPPPAAPPRGRNALSGQPPEAGHHTSPF
ncbi:hypothetical protein HPB51_022700 [Rhipicephalus microplus]|uniref:Uncharacterized protein n=1 Tax=Rhipicephalus microplus TaxID=6941 RepID=A0A9J6E469_RHIMP|nr:hypothetical protein HPB51_022700 [Rhipicephalus microplus]